ncbi:MAG: hypothetical protein HUU57_10955 [Bdellovibrio sp.]|nr:hypothetical protein [Bdellovibrio sp.]
MFDTLMYAKRLEAAGLTRDQAEAQINIIAEMVVDGVATKQDIALLKQDNTLLRQEFVILKAEISRDLEKMANKNMKFMGTMFLVSTTITIGVLGLLIK